MAPKSTIKFIGPHQSFGAFRFEHCYTAMRRGASCSVAEQEDGTWKTAYYGNPAIHNPWVKDPVTGSRWQSCTCPLVVIEAHFKTRKAAAEAGLNAYTQERC